MYHQRSMVLKEKRMVSPVVGCRHGRAASASMRALSSPSSAGEAIRGPRI
jgi:hypothetical protein